jgi:DNA-binding HxlR family transcriptional regulator
MQPHPSITPLGVEILDVLKRRWDTAPQTRQPFVVERDELLTQIDAPRSALEERLALLVADGYIREVRRAAGDPHPGYSITGLGHSIGTLVRQWVAVLRDAEAVEVRLRARYQRHTDQELFAIATAAIAAGRDPHRVVTAVLAEGRRRGSAPTN